MPMSTADACDLDDDWVELLSHSEVFRPLPVVCCGPQWILYREATAILKALCHDGPFLDTARFGDAMTAFEQVILLEAVRGGLLNESGKFVLHTGQELTSNQVHARAHIGWLRAEWPMDCTQRGDYVLCRTEFDEFVESHFRGKVSYRGIIIVDADAAPAVRFCAVEERAHRQNPTRRYQDSWGPRLHIAYTAQHPDAPIPQSAGPAMAAMILAKPKRRKS